MADKKDYGKVRVTHTMADGSVRDSVKGYITSSDQLSDTVKRLLKDILLETPKK